MVDWPNTLPQSPLLDGYTEKTKDNTLRSQNDIGPPKMRPRSTAYTDDISVRFIITTTQKGYLDTFYKTTLRGGALTYQWQGPTDSSPKTYSMTAPEYSPLTGAKWMVAFQVMRHPG